MKYNDLILKNKLLLDKLDKRYYSNFKNIEYYIGTKLKSKFRTEIIMTDILNMFLEYQENNYLIEDVLGNDIKSFCDEILNSVNKVSFKDRFFEFMYRNSLIIVLAILANFILYGNIDNEFNNILKYEIDFHLEVLIFLIPLFVIFHIGRVLYREYGKPNTRVIKNIMIYLTFIIICTVVYIFFKGKIYVVKVNFILLIILALLSLLIYFISKKYIDDEVDKYITYEF